MECACHAFREGDACLLRGGFELLAALDLVEGRVRFELFLEALLFGRARPLLGG